MDRVGARRAHEQGAVGHPDPDGHASPPGRRGPGAPRADPEHLGGAGPVVRDLTLTAHTAARTEATAAKREPRRHRVFATREGLVGGTTANGHVVTERDLFVALPSRRALAPRDSSDYAVKVCAPTGRCAFAPVWDVGPWNTRDDYWNPSDKRQEWQRPAPRAAAGAGREAGRPQRRQGPVRADRAQPGRDRPRRRHVLGRARAEGQRLGHRRLPVDGRQPARHGPGRRPGGPAQRAGREGAGRRRWPPTGPPSPCSA